MSHATWNRATRLLCVRLDTLGDVLMTTPAIRALRESLPGRQITLLTSPAGAAAGRLVPEIDEVLVYEAPWLKATPTRSSAEPDYAMIDLLSARGFDGAVIFTVYSQNPLPSALLCYLSGIPLRLAHCRENPYQLLTDWAPDPEPEQFVRHEVRRQLDLVARIGCQTTNEGLSIACPRPARHQARAVLHAAGVELDRPWVLIHPGVTAPSRQYAPSSFAIVARQLSIEHGLQVVFSGQENEAGLIEEIRSQMAADSKSLAGRLDLQQLAAVIAESPLLVTNNTGPVHVAAAVGTPVVDLYALTNPQHTPWLVPSRVLFHEVPCKNCYKSVCPEGHHDCLARVPPEAVVAATVDLLNETKRLDRFTPRAARLGSRG